MIVGPRLLDLRAYPCPWHRPPRIHQSGRRTRLRDQCRLEFGLSHRHRYQCGERHRASWSSAGERSHLLVNANIRKTSAGKTLTVDHRFRGSEGEREKWTLRGIGSAHSRCFFRSTARLCTKALFSWCSADHSRALLTSHFPRRRSAGLERLTPGSAWTPPPDRPDPSVAETL
jgi:hypothetical protein